MFLKDGQRVMTECVQCELELNKHREGMEKYSRSSVEVLLLLYSSQDLGFIDVDGLVSGFGNVLGNSGLNRILILIREPYKQPDSNQNFGRDVRKDWFIHPLLLNLTFKTTNVGQSALHAVYYMNLVKQYAYLL